MFYHNVFFLSNFFLSFSSQDPIPDDVLRNALEDQCNKNNLEGTPHFLSKVQQLYDMMDLSDGVMLLGQTFHFNQKQF
jgi:hypothetical protein